MGLHAMLAASVPFLGLSIVAAIILGVFLVDFVVMRNGRNNYSK